MTTDPAQTGADPLEEIIRASRVNHAETKRADDIEQESVASSPAAGILGAARAEAVDRLPGHTA